jgi:phenylpyruvate tautomerase PptA (4-oxalocrotonate tautomerase family)
MPVCLIEGPTGLGVNSKKELIQKVLDAMVEAYKMPDDRVYLNEYSIQNVGHTPLSGSGEWSIQSEQARIVCSIIAPPGLPLDAKRKLFRDLTTITAGAYNAGDLRNVLIFLNEHPLENVASNGFIQIENPEFSSPATAVMNDE